MSESFSLIPQAQALLNKSREERLRYIRAGPWITHPGAEKALKRLEVLMAWPPTRRMPNMLLIGPTNSGKTSILDRFRARYRSDENRVGDAIRVPILYIQAPNAPREAELYVRWAAEIYPEDVVHRVHASRSNEERLVGMKHVFEQIGLRMLIIDEVQDMLAGSPAHLGRCLNAIKQLGNDVQIPIVCAGVESAANVFNHSPQLANRFPRVTLSNFTRGDAFRKFIASYQATLPLNNKVKFWEKVMADTIYRMTEGIVGEIAALLATAAEEAITSGEETIDVELLKSLDWVRPSERHKSRQQAAVL